MTLGEAFEGRPGRAHSGVVSAAIYETMAALLSILGTTAVTASLKLDYLGPTPLHCELEFRGRLASRDGRRPMWTRPSMPSPTLVLHCEGRGEGHPFMRAKGAFVEVDLEHLVRELSGDIEGPV